MPAVWLKLKFQHWVTLSRVHLSLGKRKVVILDRAVTSVFRTVFFVVVLFVLFFVFLNVSSHLCGEPNF